MIQIYNLTLNPDLVYDVKGISCLNEYYKFFNLGCNLNLSNQKGSKGLALNDYFENVQDIYGTSYDDTLSGNNSYNIIDSGPGYDIIDLYGGKTFLHFKEMNPSRLGMKIKDSHSEQEQRE